MAEYIPISKLSVQYAIEGLTNIMGQKLNNEETECIENERKCLRINHRKLFINGNTDESECFSEVSRSKRMLHDKNFSCLKAGDHIAWHRNMKIWHHAIVVSVEHQEKKLRIIHLKKTNDKWALDDEWINIKDIPGPCHCFEYEKEITEKNPPVLVLYRALDKLGEKNYNMILNNCESFARVCKTGNDGECFKNSFWQKMKDALRLTVSKLQEQVPRAKHFSFRQLSNVTLVEVGSKDVPMPLKETVGTMIKMGNNGLTGIVIVLEGCFMIWDISTICEGTDDPAEKYIETASQLFFESMFENGITVSDGPSDISKKSVDTREIPIVDVTNGKSDVALFGKMISGLFCSITGRALGSLVGPYTGRFDSQFYLLIYDNVDVNDIELGDHLMIYGNMLHPSCHVIVVHKGETKIDVIRNTYERGVVRDTIYFEDRVRKYGFFRKVIYEEWETVSSLVTVLRAESQLGQRFYNIFDNSCKDFAYWCKHRNHAR